MHKGVIRQRNLKNLVESPVCVVADPSIVTLDGLPSIEILEKDINTSNKKKLEKFEYSYEEYVCRLGTVKYFPRVHRVAQPRRTRNVERSESLNYLKKHE